MACKKIISMLLSFFVLNNKTNTENTTIQQIPIAKSIFFEKSKKITNEIPINIKLKIKLNCIIFISELNWIIWINNKKIICNNGKIYPFKLKKFIKIIKTKKTT